MILDFSIFKKNIKKKSELLMVVKIFRKRCSMSILQQKKKENPAPLKLSQIWSTFIVLGFGLSVSLVVFLIEVLWVWHCGRIPIVSTPVVIHYDPTNPGTPVSVQTFIESVTIIMCMSTLPGLLSILQLSP